MEEVVEITTVVGGVVVVTVADRVIDIVGRHPAIRDVRLVGSRATGTATAFSDWDFFVETDDFPAVARDMDALGSLLDPLAQQWDRLSDSYCWMVMLKGPTKLDFIFAEPHEPEPPWEVRPENLVAIDAHFWDWTVWLISKRARGQAELVRRELDKMFVHILQPMGVEFRPDALDEAVASYLAARAGLERMFEVWVPRTLDREVVPLL